TPATRGRHCPQWPSLTCRDQFRDTCLESCSRLGRQHDLAGQDHPHVADHRRLQCSLDHHGFRVAEIVTVDRRRRQVDLERQAVERLHRHFLLIKNGLELPREVTCLRRDPLPGAVRRRLDRSLDQPQELPVFHRQPRQRRLWYRHLRDRHDFFACLDEISIARSPVPSLLDAIVCTTGCPVRLPSLEHGQTLGAETHPCGG